jgi:tetratricopeptide (TPR) repeat protein
VSRSVPDEEDARAEEYRKSWKALMAMAEGGSSFSGYERHCCFLNTGGEKFANVSAVSGFDFLDDGRALGLVDWDADGDLDIWAANRTAPRLRFLRNNSSTTNRFLALSLVGTTCNRDGIGTRLELHLGGETPRTLIQTRRAGEGFLSQASKWIHFGLGREGDIEKLVVRWPGGEPEEFRALDPNRRYRIVQGSSTAEAIPVPAANNRLEPSIPKIATDTAAGRIPIQFRVPLPTLNFKDFGGKPYRWQARGPFLVNLWASWCVPCVGELREFTAKHHELKAAGLDVVALSVESLPGASGSVQAAKELTDRLGAPFQTGVVDHRFYDQLALVYGSLFQDQRKFPVPMTFLIDGDGWLTAAYRGAVSVETLVEDRRLCDLSPEKYLEATLPFDGRWHSSPMRPSITLGNLGWVATALEVGGYFEESLEYWKGYFNYYEKVPRPTDPDERRRWDRELTRIQTEEAGPLFVKAGRLDDAIRGCDVALKLRPDFAKAAINRADLLEKAGRPLESVEAFRELLPHAAFGRTAAIRLVLLLAAHPDERVRNGQQALEVASRICRATQFQDPYFLDLLAAAQAETGQFDQAVQTVNTAATIARSAGQQQLASQFELRRQLYENRRPYRTQSQQ